MKKQEIIETRVQELKFIKLVPELKIQNVINSQKDFLGQYRVFWKREKKDE